MFRIIRASIRVAPRPRLYLAQHQAELESPPDCTRRPGQKFGSRTSSPAKHKQHSFMQTPMLMSSHVRTGIYILYFRCDRRPV